MQNNLVDLIGQRPEWSILFNATDRFGVTIGSFLPNLISAIILFFLGKTIAKISSGLVKKLLSTFNFSKIIDVTKTHKALAKAGINLKLSDLLAQTAYWIIFLIFITASADVLGLSVVVETLNALISYIPKIIAALLVFVITISVGRLVKSLVEATLEQMNLSYGKTLAAVSEGLIVFFGIMLSISQLGLDISIITTNLNIIVAGIVATIVLSFGLGSRSVITNLVSSYYVKKLLSIKQEVVLLGEKGTVVEITETMVVLKTKNGNVFVPNSEVINKGSLK